MDMKAVDRSTLKDINEVIIDISQPCEDRIRSYVEQIGNPYCYIDHGIVVGISFSDTHISLHDRLKAYAMSLGTT